MISNTLKMVRDMMLDSIEVRKEINGRFSIGIMIFDLAWRTLKRRQLQNVFLL